MQKLNLIVVFDKNLEKGLFCIRAKEPYKGMYNFVGGKKEEQETDIEGAYRELFEETGITKNDIHLTHLMNYNYLINDLELQVYVGKLNKEVKLVEEKNKLYWIDTTENFFDLKKFAGEGNIGHMMEQVKLYKKNLL